MQRYLENGIVKTAYQNWFSGEESQDLILKGIPKDLRLRGLVIRITVDSITRGAGAVAWTASQLASIITNLEIDDGGFKISGNGRIIDTAFREMYQTKNPFVLDFAATDTSIDFYIFVPLCYFSKSPVSSRYFVPAEEVEGLTMTLELDGTIFDQVNDVTAADPAKVKIFPYGDSAPAGLPWNGMKLHLRERTISDEDVSYTRSKYGAVHFIMIEERTTNTGNLNMYCGEREVLSIGNLDADEINRMDMLAFPLREGETREVLGNPYTRSLSYLAAGGAADSRDYLSINARGRVDNPLPWKIEFRDKSADVKIIECLSYPDKRGQ